ncbi:mitomycin resistance protein [Roseateles sp. DAIF2]|uniref:helix-hairpin-helix domain-containing protein n=1 Tax=Roseateles sp. DAIF2 TaxID=2714952 RepID=UPI0018A332BC|nr:helix-hairpin-helix domain-containing protein [Roseateles sp. DAIF2]QPF73796.1 mitomycin resistance protein [Roseateles sp. DAIF2]
MAAAAAKARHCEDCASLEQIPNIGPAMAADLRLLGIQTPQQLRGRDAFVLYQQLCVITEQRQDPCVLDTLMAAVDFMRGAPAKPWWHYTAERKLVYGQV